MAPKQGIPPFYYYFFLFVDPVLCSSAVYFCLFDHPSFIHFGIPHHINRRLLSFSTSTPKSPVSSDPRSEILNSFLLTNLGGFYGMIFISSIVLLRQSLSYPSQITISIWKTVMLGILAVDFSMIAASYRADKEGLLDVLSWSIEDFGYYFIMVAVVSARVGFILGIGGVGKGLNPVGKGVKEKA